MQPQIREIQETEYKILCELDRVCRKYDIPYYLSQGTLLGAVKYKGFIPWDDDVDVMITASAMKRLDEVFPGEAGQEYLLTNYRVERHMALSWSKIRLVNTLSRPRLYREIPVNWGVCIDIFPIHPISNWGWLRRIEEFLFRCANKLLMAEWTKYEDGRSAFERLLEKTPLGLRHAVIRAVEALLALHGDNSRWVLLPCKGIKVVKRSLFENVTMLRFENQDFPAPSGYHEYLTLNYGDYEKPLPPEEQHGHDERIGEIEWRL